MVILNAADFKVVDRIDLAKPDLPGMENIGFGANLDSIRRARQARFRFHLRPIRSCTTACSASRASTSTPGKMTFNPIGPAPGRHGRLASGAG